jgi:hypothetical protein
MFMIGKESADWLRKAAHKDELFFRRGGAAFAVGAAGCSWARSAAVAAAAAAAAAAAGGGGRKEEQQQQQPAASLQGDFRRTELQQLKIILKTREEFGQGHVRGDHCAAAGAVGTIFQY